MPREKTWKQAKERLRSFARSENPEQLSVIQNPDDAEPEVANGAENVPSLVAIDSPDDYYVYQPESLGVAPSKDKIKRRRL